MLGRYGAGVGDLGWAALLVPIIGGVVAAQTARYQTDIAKSQIKTERDMANALARISSDQAADDQEDLDRQQAARRSTLQLVYYGLGVLGVSLLSGAFVWRVYKKRRRAG